MTETSFEAEGKQQNVERSAASFSCRSTADHAARTVPCLFTQLESHLWKGVRLETMWFSG